MIGEVPASSPRSLTNSYPNGIYSSLATSMMTDTYSSAFNGMNSMAGFNTMSHGGNHVGGAAMTPVTPIATPTVPMTHAAVPNGSCIQQRDPGVSSYSCMSRAAGYDISLGPYNRHASMGLGHNPMGPSATSVAMATATHNYHQSVNSQYAIHNSHNSTGLISPGVSVPIAVPGQPTDIHHQYWTRLQ